MNLNLTETAQRSFGPVSSRPARRLTISKVFEQQKSSPGNQGSRIHVICHFQQGSQSKQSYDTQDPGRPICPAHASQSSHQQESQSQPKKEKTSGFKSAKSFRRDRYAGQGSQNAARNQCPPSAFGIGRIGHPECKGDAA